MGQVDIFLINMDRETVRYDWMRQQLDRHGLSYKRVSAVNGARLTLEDQAYYENPRRSHLSRGEIGCLLSHIMVWNSFLESETDYALILEDDVHFADDFSSFFKSLAPLLETTKPSVHRLEAFNASVTLDRKVEAVIGHRKCHQLLSNQGGAAAYVLNRCAATELLNARDQFSLAPDTELFDPDRRAVNNLSVSQWLPAPCIQDMLHTSPVGLTSSLAGSRSDERAGLVKPSLPAVQTLKSIGRPLYTLLYDLSLYPNGMTRKHCRFG